MNKSDYLKAATLNAWLRGVSPTLPSAWYLALYTVAPTSAGGGTELSGGSYVREAVTFGAPSSGIVANAGAINFPSPTAAWGTLVAVAVFDAPTGGNMLYFGNLSAAKAVDVADPVFFPIGYFTIQEL
jgi:hypothetical protein